MDTESLSHTQWNCKYHIVFAVPGTNYSGIKVKDQTGAEIPVSKNISEDTSLLLTWNSKIQLQISI